ncbi:hypothetical protein ASPZODRAFT_1923408 [Penicilliopsis zonata CBS 506.65]|uniref:CAP-Gly domain-containing protein n=1 Tax=Penicilliopsis zonata CBS 506.65 TaxID=1073090 RepID=A0A1L9SJ84_9EURO|nr:hypothetical protein ASPZODRAFT_1923408 [Penicilliopsis zonata CBS 506.65]OJJ47225.1 hypothetical protein ASPZODRAFT_1923408 [Penicilliopsis zonata CBS 506.65]
MGDVSPGQVVTLTDGRQATVRFVGPTHFAAGDWIGIELDEGTGKNDGAVQGERYFDCEPGFGMFIRPTAVVSVAEPPPARDGKQPLKNNGNPTAAPRGRPQSSMVPGGLGIKKPSGLSATNVKRHSATASPSPAPKVATTPRTLRSPTKSPTKQLSSTSGPPSSRMSMGGAPRPSPAITPKARPTPSTRTSMGPPPPLPTTSSKRPSLSGPAGRTTRPPSQTMSSGPSGLSKRPAIQPNLTKRPSETADGGRDGQADDPESPGRDGESGLAEGITSQVTRRTSGTARPNASRPSLSPLAQRQAQSNALTRELDELKTKLKVMEKKRAEDREKLKNLEKLQTERDKFESIIQKLQAKYQPQQLEIGDLRKKLKDAETRLEEVERLQAEHESLMEMASLDREMAEETADAFKHECETLRLKVEELQLEVEVLREENEELGQVMSPEEKSTQGWLQMEKSNERLREALIRLRDMTQQQESELRDQIKELEEDLEDYRAVKAQYETTKEKLLVSETNVEDLKQQLETALGAEEMIEELADKNMLLERNQ